VHQFFNRIMSKDAAWATTQIQIISAWAFLFWLE
jgi:hypothetical protein